MQVKGWAAKDVGAALEPYSFTLPDPGPGEVQIEVAYCGLCHSDISMLDNVWGISRYPLVPGHEIIGTVRQLGSHVSHLRMGQTVGVGWMSASCGTCNACVGGDQNLCRKAQPTIAGRHGGFASHLNAQAAWTLPIAADVQPQTAGPLLCGGITVFNPLIQFGIKPTDKIGVVGVGGLGHLALQFANKWGCEVTAFTSSPEKEPELHQLGAHRVVSSRDSTAWEALAGHFDLLLVTANVSLDWPNLLNMLGPRGRLHFVGAVLEPLAVQVFDLLGMQRQVSASPIGAPAVMRLMLEFCGRHQICAMCEYFNMSDINLAIARVKLGKARYRIVVTNDL